MVIITSLRACPYRIRFFLLFRVNNFIFLHEQMIAQFKQSALNLDNMYLLFTNFRVGNIHNTKNGVVYNIMNRLKYSINVIVIIIYRTYCINASV